MLKKSITILFVLSLICSQLPVVISSAKDNASPVLRVSDPKNNQTYVTLNCRINLTFSENIYKAVNFSKIKITKNNKPLTITTTIYRNHIAIEHRYMFAYNSNYIVSVPVKAVKDKSGNLLTRTILINFKSRPYKQTPSATPTISPTLTPSATPTTTPAVSPTLSPTAMPMPSDTYKAVDKVQSIASNSPDGKAHILFVGNSLTYYGGIPQVFATFLNKSNLPVVITQYTPGGSKLTENFADLQNFRNIDIIKNIDIVILQDYSGCFFDTETIDLFKRLFEQDTEFYYLLTEFNITSQFMTEISNYNDGGHLKYIPGGYTHEMLLYNEIFTYDQLHVNDYYRHPNKIYGYLAACTVYCEIFGVTPVGLPYDFLDDETQALIPGESKDEKNLKILDSQAIISDVLNIEIPPI